MSITERLKIENKIRQTRFNIQWNETNLHYMLGEPRPFTKSNWSKIEFMKSEINRLEQKLIVLLEEQIYIRGF